MPSRLLTYQQDFARILALFIVEVTNDPELDVEVTFGDFYATRGHMPGSNHGRRLASDLNVFHKGEWLRTYNQAPDTWDELGQRWKRLDSRARWGGDFRGDSAGDYNHFSFGWVVDKGTEREREIR